MVLGLVCSFLILVIDKPKSIRNVTKHERSSCEHVYYNSADASNGVISLLTHVQLKVKDIMGQLCGPH